MRCPGENLNKPEARMLAWEQRFRWLSGVRITEGLVVRGQAGLHSPFRNEHTRPLDPDSRRLGSPRCRGGSGVQCHACGAQLPRSRTLRSTFQPSPRAHGAQGPGTSPALASTSHVSSGGPALLGTVCEPRAGSSTAARGLARPTDADGEETEPGSSYKDAWKVSSSLNKTLRWQVLSARQDEGRMAGEGQVLEALSAQD